MTCVYVGIGTPYLNILNLLCKFLKFFFFVFLIPFSFCFALLFLYIQVLCNSGISTEYLSFQPFDSCYDYYKNCCHSSTVSGSFQVSSVYQVYLIVLLSISQGSLNKTGSTRISYWIISVSIPKQVQCSTFCVRN